MKIKAQSIKNVATAVAIVAALVIGSLPVGVSAAGTIGTKQIREAQTIMKKFGIPAGTVDGRNGPQTQRGLCAFRHMSGLPINRNNLDNATLVRLRNYNVKYKTLNTVPAAKLQGATTYVAVQQTCQAMFYVQNLKYQRVFAVSTGARSTPTQNLTRSLGGTETGWSCSDQSPDSCAYHVGLGRFATTKKNSFGNMYNKRHVYNGVFVHGSTYVPTFPDSHGCIRVTPADADWMFDHVGNTANPPIIIGGTYKW